VQGVGVLLAVEPPAALPHEVVDVVDVELVRGEAEQERRLPQDPQLRVGADGFLHAR
jgi:hypothetical protein